jgi:hypothetical protein
MTELLLCTRCQRLLPASAFRPSPRMRRAYSSWCLACHVDRTREWRIDHRDAINAHRRSVWAENREAINRRRRLGYRPRVPDR